MHSRRIPSEGRERIVEAYESAGYRVIVHRMEGIKLANCIGCFGCWLKTPGECIHKDAGRQIAKVFGRNGVVDKDPETPAADSQG